MMNCRRFQNRLYEYVEGTLSPGMRAAADQHLARCSTCRQAVRQEQQLAQSLSERLRQDTEALALRPDVRERILAVLEHKSAPPMDGESVVGSWNRFAWPLAIAASLLLVVAFLRITRFPGAELHETEIARSDVREIPVSIQVSYCVPTYKFRQEGNLVVDTLTCETMVANETLWTGGQEPVQRTQGRKMPL